MCDCVIDECVLIRALEAEGTDASDLEVQAAELLAVVQDEHRWIMSFELIDIYYDRLYQAPNKGVIWRRIQASLAGQIWDPGRHLWLDEVPTITGPYHSKDQVYVSAAAAAPAGSLLVTDDHRLLRQLCGCDLPERHGFRPCTIAEAMALLGPASGDAGDSLR
jgi:hypothetical protein